MYLSIQVTLKNHVSRVDPSYASAQAVFENLDPENDADHKLVRAKMARGEKLHRNDESGLDVGYHQCCFFRPHHQAVQH
jgi:hypothetical protein